MRRPAFFRRARSPSDGSAFPAAGGGRGRTNAAGPDALAARLPALLVAAERVAATVAQGVHGRRRAGQGDSFWQYRQLMPGESATRIDWRQSARTTRAFVRETEWEAAQTVSLWRDGSPSMEWRSDFAADTKRERAELLLVALAALLLRGGEHVRLNGDPLRSTFSGRQSTDRLARSLLHLPPEALGPDPSALPPHGMLVLFGDFLAPLPETERMLAALNARPVSCQLVQILDPAELSLPFEGRVRFTGPEGEPEEIVPDAAAIREAYAERLRQHTEGLAGLCRAAGFGFTRHDTSAPPEAALLALHAALSPGGLRHGGLHHGGSA